MTPIEMIVEWRKGCTCGGPVLDQIEDDPPGTHSPAECVECTVALIEAMEVRLLEALLRERIAAARLHAGVVGPMHALWDVISDAEALLADRPTMLDYGDRTNALRILAEQLV